MELCNGIILRKAVREDCTQILDLIKGIAAFQKSPDSVDIDAKVLEKDGFDEEIPFYNCVVAEDPNEKTDDGRGKIVGYSVYLFAYGTWNGRKLYIEDIYVTEKYRSKKVGSALFNMLNKIALESGCKKMEWSVTDWNSGARDFYRNKGAVNLTEKEGWLVYRLEKEAMHELHRKTTTPNGVGDQIK